MSLEDEWKHFLKLSYEVENITSLQKLCLQRAFYASVLTALTKTVEANNAKSDVEGAKRFGQLMKECLETCAELAGMNEEKPENN